MRSEEEMQIIACSKCGKPVEVPIKVNAKIVASLLICDRCAFHYRSQLLVPHICHSLYLIECEILTVEDDLKLLLNDKGEK
jgi:hypothetical protein